jgi:hypothetical protein
VGKLEYGKLVWATDAQGKKYSYLDWTTDPQDIANLLIWTNSQLGIKYKPITAKFNAFSYDPAEIPILYLTGHEGFEWTDDVRKNIRWFLQDGGYLVGDTCCGSKPFAEAFIKEMAAIFPDRPLKTLGLDHPLFNCFYQIGQVQYRDGAKNTEKKSPLIYGVNIGCRTAVMLAPYDVSCGWDGHPEPGGIGLALNDARQLGANMITYCLANYQLGRFLSTEKVYFEKDEKTRDEFVFGQVMHGGDWDPDPSAVATMLKYVSANSTMPIQFKRANVDLKKADAFLYPFLYMTGHDEFKLSDQEVAALRNYVNNGGVLLVDACCGRDSFDQAFRREMKRVLPQRNLEPLPASHPLFSAKTQIRNVGYTDMVKQSKPDLNTAELEGISISGALAVIYSKYDLGCGWEEQIHPYSKGYASADALKVGMNTLVYAMTH